MNARIAIPRAYCEELSRLLTGSGDYVTNIYGNVESRTRHFQDIENFPTITITPGPETREDMPSNFTMCRLEVAVRVYVKNQDDAQGELEQIIGDLEKFFDTNLDIEYNLITNNGQETRKTISNTILSITTDEGLLEPQGIGEILVSVEYEKRRDY